MDSKQLFWDTWTTEEKLQLLESPISDNYSSMLLTSSLINKRNKCKRLRISILYLGEVSQYFGHFISSLSATDVDDNITVGELGKWLRDDSFTTSESSWDSSGSTLHTSEIIVDRYNLNVDGIGQK